MLSTVSFQLAPRGTSVYEHLRERLRAEVVAPGKPGDKVPGEKTLATLFGVSPVTMSRALQELQSEGVILRVPGKGTFLAETVRGGYDIAESNAPVQDFSEPWSGILSPTSAAPLVQVNAAIIANLGLDDGGVRYGNWEPRIVSRLEKLIQTGGGTTITINRDLTPFGEDVVTVESLREMGVNSVFLIPDADLPGETYRKDLQKWQQSDPHVVMTGFLSETSDQAHVDGVNYDDAYGAFLIGEHLAALGHKRIAYLVPDEPIYIVPNQPIDFAPRRLQRMCAALEQSPNGEHGATVEEVRVPTPQNAERYQGGRQLPRPDHDIWISCGESAAHDLELEERFSALVFANDNMARGFIATRRAMKQKITASLVGYDDRAFASALGLTTVHPPIEEMADYAFRLTCSRLQQPFEAGRLDITLKPMLIRRSSTRPVTI